MKKSAKHEAWELDQIGKSLFFHRKLHEWGLIRVAEAIENVDGEKLQWDLTKMGVSEDAWNKVIHKGIKPVRCFANPEVLMRIPRSVSYYRMLSMVSQKSMNQVKLPIKKYEIGSHCNQEKSWQLARHLNNIICQIILVDEVVNMREFDIWRAMAAGAQAQGSWQNLKGDRAEDSIKGLIKDRLGAEELISIVQADGSKFILKDERVVVFGEEPDVAIYFDDIIQIAVEIKGGIDPAGILERVGAAIKSLSRARSENRESITILVMPRVAMTEKAVEDLELNRDSVNHWYTMEDVLGTEDIRNKIFDLLQI